MQEKIKRILLDVNRKFESNWDADFLKVGLIDSFEIMNIILQLEQEFDIEIEPEFIVPENFCNLEAIQKLVNQSAEK